MTSPASASERATPDEDALRAARLDECIMLSAHCMSLALAGAVHRARLAAGLDATAPDPVITELPWQSPPPPRITRL
jgi:hypothetical protein